jgi:acylphosphatase
VWFRQACAEQARIHGVAGWVRNRRDGRVEAVFEGDERAVERMVAWCGRGPERAEVTDVEVISEEPESLHGFRVVSAG